MFDPELVAHDALDALPPAVAEQPHLRETALLIAEEALRYAAGTLPLEVSRADRQALVAMLCEDLEAPTLLAGFLAPREGEERARVLEIGTGFGFPGFVLARTQSVRVDVLDPEPRRAWFLRRLINLVSVRNLRVHVDDATDPAVSGAASYDLVLIKHAPVAGAVRRGAPFLRPGGTLALWAGVNPGESGLKEAGRPDRLTVPQPLPFHSSVLAGHVLLLARRPDEPKPVATPSEPATDEESVSV